MTWTNSSANIFKNVDEASFREDDSELLASRNVHTLGNRAYTLPLLLVGCATAPPQEQPGAALARYRIESPAGFQVVPSEVPELEWESTFFRIARDVRLLPKLHPEVRGANVTLLANQQRDRFLFIAAVNFTDMEQSARREFMRAGIRSLFNKNPNPDFQNTRSTERWDVIHSEGIRQDENAIAHVSIYAVNGKSNVAYILGGVWLSSGMGPFAMDNILRNLKDQLTQGE